MKSAILPAILMFAVAGGRLLVVREYLTGQQPDAAAVALAETELAAPVPEPGSRQAVLRKENNGHYWATVQVNGFPVRMMVDTGASLIVLTEKDARSAGIDPAALPRTINASTASGPAKAGSVELKRVSIDGVEAVNVAAAVMDEGLPHSLLGMSFLTKLSGWQVTPSAMVLRQ